MGEWHQSDRSRLNRRQMLYLSAPVSKNYRWDGSRLSRRQVLYPRVSATGEGSSGLGPATAKCTNDPLAVLSARAACVDIDTYLVIPFPMAGDMVISLDAVDTIECEGLDEDDINSNGLETVVVKGGSLTLKSSSSVRFVNMGFTVMTGANLVFDMPETNFGPNTEGRHRIGYTGIGVKVEEYASATFVGQFVAKEVSNVATLFRNAGTMEFLNEVFVQDGGNVLRDNTGVVKFRGDATFKDNQYLALSNRDSAFVRFSEGATFDNNAFDFDGAWGCSVANHDTSKISFRGDTAFKNNNCGEGVAVYNEGTINFYGKASFNDNVYRGNGGAVSNYNGSMAFKAAVQFSNNTAADYGGGLGVEGGDVTLSKAVIFDGNTADSGAAFAVINGTLTFEKPEVVRYMNGGVFDDEYSDDRNCLIGEVSDGATLVGFPGDDVCVPAAAP
eukprot:jgi/Undpi1/2289/HiC_scaffold_13.g05673.m1